jgi:hypothetical protein
MIAKLVSQTVVLPRLVFVAEKKEMEAVSAGSIVADEWKRNRFHKNRLPDELR